MHYRITKRLSLALGLIFLAASGSPAKAQIIADTTEHWRYGGNININFSQVALENWTGGGQNSIAANGLLHFEADYTIGKAALLNELDLGYGLTRQGGPNADFRKSDDRLQIRSNYTRDIAKNLELSGAFNFLTSITRGFDYVEDEQGNEQENLISAFMAPGYLVSTIGLTYNPSKKLSLNLSPVTGKTTFVLNNRLSDQGTYGVPAGSRVRQELGTNFRLESSGSIVENVNYQTSVRLFNSYTHFTEIDINWDGQINLKVNDYLTTNLTIALIYDEDVDVTRADGTTGPDTQFKEVLAVGLKLGL
jgi:hypothetical protein